MMPNSFDVYRDASKKLNEILIPMFAPKGGMMPNGSGKFVRLDCGDEIDVDLNGETVTFRRVKGARFEIVAHKRVGVGKVRKRIKPKPRLQPNQREKVAFSDEATLQS